MGLAAVAVSVIGTAELDKPGDVNARSAGIIGPQHNPPTCDLDSQIADRVGVKQGGQRPHHRLIPNEATTPGARIGESGSIECISGFAVIRKGISQHETVGIRQLMIELERSFGFGAETGKRWSLIRVGRRANARLAKMASIAAVTAGLRSDSSSDRLCSCSKAA